MSDGADPIRVAVVDDHEVVRVGLGRLLEAQPDCLLVGEAASVEQALALLDTTPVDVLLLDIRLPDGSGVDVCRRWKRQSPDTGVIMLTSFSDDDLLFASLEAGASAYLLKNARSRTLLSAIRTVAEGGSLLDPDVAARVLHRATAPASPDPLDELTESEQRILSLMGEGLTNREIGAQVYLSEKTVKHYVSNILSKLGLSRRAEVAAYLARRGALTSSRSEE
jgi:two-component system response regulator DevR